MTKDKRIRLLGDDNQKIKRQNAVFYKIILACISGFKYILRLDGRDDQATKLLDSFGSPLRGLGPETRRLTPQEVSRDIVNLIQEEFLKLKAEAPENQDVKRVELGDGQEIIFTTEFDRTFHECCECGCLHEIEIEWGGEDSKPTLTTKWYRRGSLPTKEEVEQSGGKVLQFKERTIQ